MRWQNHTWMNWPRNEFHMRVCLAQKLLKTRSESRHGKSFVVFRIPKLSFWMRNDVRCFTVWFISSDVLQKIKWSTTICTCVYLITVFYLVYFTMKVCHAGKLEGQHCVSNVWHIFCDPSCTRKYQFLHMFPATKINLLYILIEQKMKKGVIVIKTQANQVYFCE